MSLLIFTHQKHRCITQKSRLNYELMQLRDKLMNLQSYAASVSDGKLSMSEMMNAPAQMFNRMSIFLQYSNASAYNGARQEMAMFGGNGGLKNLYESQVQGQQLNSVDQGRMQNQMQQLVFNKFRDQQYDKIGENEKQLLHVQETKIEQQVAQKEGQLKMVESEEEKVSKAEDDAAKKSAPEYVA